MSVPLIQIPLNSALGGARKPMSALCTGCISVCAILCMAWNVGGKNNG